MTPIFSISDYPTAREFYLGWLGFGIDWEDEPDQGPVYLQISRDDVVLHLTVPADGSCFPSRARAEMRGLLAYHRQLQAKTSPYPCPALVRASWNERVYEMEATDPFGNHIIFCEPGQ